MLPARHRLTCASDFRSAVRRGRRRGSTRLVVHLQLTTAHAPPRLGLVVSKAVGSAVVRNRVKRRLRELARDPVIRLPAGALVVIRALPPAAGAGAADLGADLDAALAYLLERSAAVGATA